MAHILVADDEPSIRRVLRLILEQMGHEVTEAENGLAALAKYREILPAAMLVDLYMPELDGVETMIRLKADYPDAKVVAISGGGWKAKGPALEEMTALGAVDTIAKPFTADQVVETVERVLGAAPP